MPLQFTFYSEVLEHALRHQMARRGRYWLVFHSMWHTICRYGPRPAILGAGFGALAKARRKKVWSFSRIARVIVDRLYRARPFAFRRSREREAIFGAMLDGTAELLFGEALTPSERASSVDRLMHGRAPSTVLRELLFGRGAGSILEQPESIVSWALEAVVLGRPAGKSQEQALRTANEALSYCHDEVSDLELTHGAGSPVRPSVEQSIYDDMNEDAAAPAAVGASEGEREQFAESLARLGEQLAGADLGALSERILEVAGEIDLTIPHLQACWGGPFNGQEARQALVRDLIERVRPTAIVETGTFRGLTTQFLAELFPGPVHSCEINRRYSHQARKKLQGHANANVHEQDSRACLAQLAQTLSAPVWFYLDSHWEADLPLIEEVEIITREWSEFAIMIDDFEVPFDPGYQFDDYGPGKRLCLDILAGFRDRELVFHFPSISSEAETGAKRGVVVITSVGRVAESVSASPLLRSAVWQDWRITELETALLAEKDARVADLEVAAVDKAAQEGELERAQLDVQEHIELIAQLSVELERAQLDVQEHIEHIAQLHKDLSERTAAAEVLRRNLAELRRSRWLKLGRKLRIAKLTSWERRELAPQTAPGSPTR